MAKISNENLIHIKLDYSEAVNTKRDILSLQMNLLKLIQTIKGYGFYRNQELELKLLLYNKIRELKFTLEKLQKTLPKAKIPKILEKEEYDKTEMSSRRKISPDKSIEEQLQEIQGRLNELQGRDI